MSQAENLLNSLSEEQTLQSASPINDLLLIDAEGRITNIPNTEIILGVETDQDVERKYFKCPRIVGDNIDLTTLQLRINYQNAEGNKDKYIVEDVVVNEQYITFSWLLSAKVLASKGTVFFAIQAVNVEDDGTVKNRWNTTLASGNVLETLIVDDLYDYEEEQARDVLAQLLRIVDDKSGETDDKYFDIDYNGLISLKPEYRGESKYDSLTFSISDKGLGVAGSKNHELPSTIVIPANIDGEEVKGFQSGIFHANMRVKEISIPNYIKELPNAFVRESIYFEKLENAEQVESIGAGALAWTRIKEARFPNLKTLGNNTFKNCSCLVTVDLGKITEIGTNVFQYCENLTNVLGGENITTIGDGSFYVTRRLKSLPFLKNVTNIGTNCFRNSACNTDEVPSTCILGTNAIHRQYNDTDYWTGVAFTPCKNPVNTLFHQKDIRWADKPIANYVDENGKPCTYGSNGCAFVTLAEIYSAYEGVTFESPEEFVPILEAKGLLQYDYRYREPWCQIANGLGYTTEYYSIMNTENLAKIYDALLKGALLYKSVAGVDSIDGGHATLGYGINTKGEMLVADSSMHCNEIGIYENHKTSWEIYKHGSRKCDCVVVKKQ